MRINKFLNCTFILFGKLYLKIRIFVQQHFLATEIFSYRKCVPKHQDIKMYGWKALHLFIFFLHVLFMKMCTFYVYLFRYIVSVYHVSFDLYFVCIQLKVDWIMLFQFQKNSFMLGFVGQLQNKNENKPCFDILPEFSPLAQLFMFLICEIVLSYFFIYF